MAPLSLTAPAVLSPPTTSCTHLRPPRTLRRPSPLPPITAVATPPKRPPVLRSVPTSPVEVIRSLEGWAGENMLPLLKPVEKCWQPHEFLPDSTRPFEDFTEELRELRERTAELSDDYFVVLVGDMITEDALPTNHSWLSITEGMQPKSLTDEGAWATWIRGWSAEENHHGDMLRSYLYLSGRVDMVMVDCTVQHLINNGMELGTENNPYLVLVYGTFQERAAAISHGNTARLAKQQGDSVLARVCGTIAADEKRHEKAYADVVAKLLEVDPDGAMLAISTMMKKRIVMPAHLMYDGQDPQLFHHYSAVAQRIGVYTTSDYADMLDHFVGRWKLEKVEGLTAEGRAAQEFVCGLAPRIRRLQERAEERAKSDPYSKDVKFSWIFNKELTI